MTAGEARWRYSRADRVSYQGGGGDTAVRGAFPGGFTDKLGYRKNPRPAAKHRTPAAIVSAADLDQAEGRFPVDAALPGARLISRASETAIRWLPVAIRTSALGLASSPNSAVRAFASTSGATSKNVPARSRDHAC